jgi:hypothetical protein
MYSGMFDRPDTLGPFRGYMPVLNGIQTTWQIQKQRCCKSLRDHVWPDIVTLNFLRLSSTFPGQCYFNIARIELCELRLKSALAVRSFAFSKTRSMCIPLGMIISYVHRGTRIVHYSVEGLDLLPQGIGSWSCGPSLGMNTKSMPCVPELGLLDPNYAHKLSQQQEIGVVDV